jgi:tetratricopeptide (TPR) repeat protein
MDIKTQKNLTRATKLAKKGAVKEAEKIFNQILIESPKNQEAKKGLAMLNQNSESARPTQNQIDFVMNLYSTGKIIDAIKSIDELVKQFPQEPLLFNISGACYLAAESFQDAVKSFKKAVELKEDYAAAQYNLGVAYRSLEQNDYAMSCFKKAININPAYPDAHNNLGLLLLQNQQITDAAEHFEWAVAYKPEFAVAHNNLGAALQELRKYDESINSYKKAVEINPAYAQAHNNLGISFQIIGDQNKSIEHYEKALSIKSDYAQVHQDLSALKLYKSNDPQIKTIENLLSDDKTTESDKVFLCFALAKAYDDIGNSKGLYECLDEGNRLRKKQLNYSIDNSVRLHSVIKKLFSSPKPISKKNVSKNLGSKRPIFILGMPRSGTTLVEQIIASHKEVYGAEEINTLTNLVAKILNDPSSYNTKGLQEKTLVTLRNDYLNGLDNLNVNENILTDKLPLNFQYIGFILSSMPDAKIIHVTRDPRAICWSNLKHNFSSNGNGWAYNMQDLTDFYGLYEELMNFWHKAFPNKIYDVSYENLTKNQEEETKKLLKYCELKWDKNCLNFYSTKRAVKTASSAQVRKKIYQGSSDAWKVHEKYLKPMISSLTK